jgi:arylformamidase
MSSHTGTHMDARVHFIPGGWTMEALDLSRSVGLCRVVDLTHVEEQAGRADLEAAEVAGQVRLLLKTRNSDGKLMQREEFEECYSAISRKAAEYLIEIGVETIGVDYLSVKPFEDGESSTPTARYSGQTW